VKAPRPAFKMLLRNPLLAEFPLPVVVAVPVPLIG